MTMRQAKWAIPAVAFVLAMPLSASACYAFDNDYFSRRDTVTDDAGDAMATNSVTHTLDPWAPHSKDTEIKVDGQRARVGITRYQNGQSGQPKGLSGKKSAGGSMTTK